MATTMQLIAEAKQRIRGERTDAPKKIKTRRRGVKEYLTSFKVGETREYDGKLRYDSLRSVASHYKHDFGCVFVFGTVDGVRYITRVK